MTTPSARTQTSAVPFWWIIGGILLFLVVVGQCSSKDNGGNLTAGNMVDSNMMTAIAAQTPPAPAPLNAASLRRGGTHLRLAVEAEGLSGAMIYSQNCYDALGREFGWDRLDICGAFDALASRATDRMDTNALATEAVYFQSEAVAGRYLAAATGAGEAAAEADQRLSDLQARMANVRLPRIGDSAAETENGMAASDLNNISENLAELAIGEEGE